MEKLKLYRRRFIPDEMIYLKDDKILFIDSRMIITSWKSLRPRQDFFGGRSCYFLNEGYKVSWFFDHDGNRVYTYCDIISTEYNETTNEYIFNDLLIDVVIYENGFVKILDLSEIPKAIDLGLITVDLAMTALSTADRLLEIIYSGRLNELTQFLER